MSGELLSSRCFPVLICSCESLLPHVRFRFVHSGAKHHAFWPLVSQAFIGSCTHFVCQWQSDTWNIQLLSAWVEFILNYARRAKPLDRSWTDDWLWSKSVALTDSLHAGLGLVVVTCMWGKEQALGIVICHATFALLRLLSSIVLCYLLSVASTIHVFFFTPCICSHSYRVFGHYEVVFVMRFYLLPVQCPPPTHFLTFILVSCSNFRCHGFDAFITIHIIGR